MGVGNGVQIGEREAAVGKQFAGQRQHAANVIARSEFRHDAAVVGVHGHLGMQPVAQQPAPGVEQSDAGFVTGGFNPQY